MFCFSFASFVNFLPYLFVVSFCEYHRCFICYIILLSPLIFFFAYLGAVFNSHSNREYGFNLPFAVLSPYFHIFTPHIIVYTIPAQSFLRPMPFLHAETHRTAKCATVYCKLLDFHSQPVCNLAIAYYAPPQNVIQDAISQTLFRLFFITSTDANARVANFWVYPV